MFTAFYGLTFNPFQKENAEQCYYTSADFTEFRSRMEYFQMTKGFAVVFGRPGTGKTCAIRNWTAELNTQLFQVVYLPLSRLTLTDFYRNMCIGLGLVPRSRKIDMFHQIQLYITEQRRQKRRTPLLILDEAQYLDNQVLSDLPMLLSFDMDSKDHAMLLLCGQSGFAEKLNLHVHEALRQRIALHYEFGGLRKPEIESYVTALLKAAGVSDNIVEPAAFEALAAVCEGSPRLVNRIMERALMAGYREKTRQVGPELIRIAYQELGLFQTQGS